eukprot:932212-Rhodomonas_salina.1
MPTRSGRALMQSASARAQIFIAELAFNAFGHWFWPFVKVLPPLFSSTFARFSFRCQWACGQP